MTSIGVELQRGGLEKDMVEAAVSGKSDQDGRDSVVATEQKSIGDAEVEVGAKKEKKSTE